MSHWLEDEINKLKEKELNLNPALVKQNYMKNAALINGFFNLLKKSFDDLTRVMGKDYKFTYRTLSVLKICDNEFIEFSGSISARNLLFSEGFNSSSPILPAGCRSSFSGANMIIRKIPGSFMTNRNLPFR